MVTNNLGDPRSLETIKFINNNTIKDNLNNILKCNKINARYPGDDNIFSINIFPWKHQLKTSLTKDITRSKVNLNKIPFIQVNEINKEIYFKKGDIYLENNLISFTISKKILLPKIDMVLSLIKYLFYEHYNKKKYTLI